MRKVWIGIGTIVALVVIVLLVLSQRSETREDRKEKSAESSRPRLIADRADDEHRQKSRAEDTEETSENEPEETEDPPEPMTEEEKREAEAEKKVDAFDNLTDKWMEPSAKGVTMADIDNFAKAFRQVPKDRQDECIHRALNLIPDENVMLLAGVLMDKEMDKEIVEEVYNDVLNRDEDVKKPILQQIFKDKSHPCWADTAWILDVTGELPKKK